MPINLTYCDLPSEIGQWPELPLSLDGDEVFPINSGAEQAGWLLYGCILDKSVLSAFQRNLSIPLVVEGAWCIENYRVVYLAGSMPPSAKKAADELGLDVAGMENVPSLRSPGLLVMDMDSTAIQIECIDEIARLAGVGDAVAEVTERAMQGELDFSTSLRERVAKLAGADAGILEHVLNDLPLMPGLSSLIHQLQALNWHVAIASGGFTYFADHLKDRFHLVAAVANQLDVHQGKLTGSVIGKIVDAKHKADMLKSLAQRWQIPLSQTVAVGDGANDLPMIKAAGLGVAYHAKPQVYAEAPVAIRHADLMGLMCVLSASIQDKEG